MNVLLFTVRLSRRRRKMYICHSRLCVYVCLSVRGRIPTLLHGPGWNLAEWQGCPSCVLLGGLAIGAWVSLL